MSTSALDQIGYDGIAHGTTALDAADALDLEQAIARRAKLNGQLGDEDSLDVRRAKALGEIAREDLILDLQVADPRTGEITRTIPGRKTELILHLSATDQTVGRFGNTRTPISVEQIKEWLSLANTTIIVRPVIDLAGDQAVDSYEIPDRIARQVKLRDHHCVFPLLHETGRVLRPRPHPAHGSDGGQTSTHNLCPGCRGHHRMKTAGKASYRMLKPGTYHWTLPSARTRRTWSTRRAAPPTTGSSNHRPARAELPSPNRPRGGGRGVPEVAERPPEPVVATRRTTVRGSRWAAPGSTPLR